MWVHKHFNKIAITVTAFALIITLLFMNGKSLGITPMENIQGYENRLFDQSRVHTIDIVMDDWDGFISNAQSEEYSLCSVIIDGKAVNNVGIRGKGNTSLSSVASMGSQRYSFKIEFDKYDSAKNYYGLDKLSLNNLIQDNTFMKDYLTYTLMAKIGADAPLCSFVYITVNGEDWGLYLAVEGIEDSFLSRNYQSQGNLYKPDSMEIGGGKGNGKDFNMENFNAEDFAPNAPEQGFNKANGQKPDGFGGRISSGVTKLQYIDDNYESYQTIWDSAKTDITDNDKDRLIGSLKKLSAYEDIAKILDTENLIKYFVVHNYVCNGDSYTGSMIHNYYLYENNGMLSMLPWDYNLAFGGFEGNNATSVVNSPIDLSLTDRPMVNWIFESEEYTRLYHKYFEEFLNNTDIEAIIDNAYNLISPFMEKDPTAFCTYEEFETGVNTLKEFCNLRTKSVLTQLKNNTTSENITYEDASHINISDMGSMRSTAIGRPGGNMQMPEGGMQMPEGGMQMPEGGMQMPEGGMQMPEGGMPMPEGGMQMPEGGMQMPEGGMQMPEGGMPMPEGGMPPGGFGGPMGDRLENANRMPFSVE